MTEQALIIAGHGSHRNPDSSTPVHAAVETIRERGIFAEVRPAFWKEAPSLRNVLHTIDAEEAIVVPLFVSEGYFVDQVLPREFGLGEDDRGISGSSVSGLETDDPAADDSLTVRYADPVGTHSAMTEVIAARARRMLGESGDDEGSRTDDVALAVVGHGTERNPNSADAIYDHVEALRDRGEFAEVGALFMDEAPYVEDALDHFAADELAVVPLFVADGFHTQDEIPELLGLTDDPTTGYPVPATVDGRRVWYASAVGTDPLVVDVVLERATEAGAEIENRTDVSRPVREAAGSAFLQWVEDARGDDESGRIWGELAIVPNEDGGYDVTHHDDAEAHTADLEVVEVNDLRELVRYADDGRYRPFAGETTLPTGWVVPNLGETELLAAVATIYPVSVEHWAAEREGDLDPVHFREIADHQTGIYESVSDLSSAELSRTVAACCGNCAKRREWDETEGEQIDCERGDGQIPCREPCSFLVAAAREFRQHEREDSSFDQSTDCADPTVPRGDLTDPSNLYRVRYREARTTSDRDTRTTSESDIRPEP